MKKLFLLLAVFGLMFSACTEGGEDDGNGNKTEQPGGNPDAPNNPGGGVDIPADKTQSIKFQDGNTKLICTVHWDENEDEELSYEEAAAVTDLGTAFKGTSILAFTELKYFTSLEKIADSAFEGCTSLVKITLPQQITAIGTSAFNGCTNLKKIAVPDSVTEIGYYAFRDCSSLASITISGKCSVTEIDGYAFSGCSLKDTYINITDLAAYATNNNTHRFPGEKHLLVNGSEMTELVIPDSVTEIGGSVFSGCNSLTSITIPDSVTKIGDSAFAYCSSLPSVTIGNSVTKIGQQAFEYCSSLTNVTIPDSVTMIGEYAFASCSLTSVTIPDSVTEIGGYAFAGCSNLTSITIPDSVTEIGEEAFDGCYFNESDFVNNSQLDAEQNGYWGATICIVQSDGLCINGTTVVYCRPNATSVTIPDSVTKIGEEAFSNCSSLTSVTIPDRVYEIGEDAFRNCSSLTSVYCKPTTPPAVGLDAFYNNASGRKIYVPTASVSAYKSKRYWSDYAADIVGYDF